MSSRGRFAIILIFGWLAQASLVPLISFGAVQPDLVLVIICAYGFFYGPTAGAVGGFVGGLLQDLLAPGSIGLGALAKTIIGYLSGQVERTILGDSFLVPMVAIGLVSLVYQVIYIGLAFFVGEAIEFLVIMKSVVLPSALYTALLSLVVFPYISRVLGVERQITVFK